MPHPRRLVALGLLLVAVGLSGCGTGKSYSFPEVHIDATVLPDGTLEIEERRTFDFRGSFSFAFFTVEHRRFGDVVDFELSEGDDVYEEGAPEVPGHVRIEDPVLDGPGGHKLKATWWFRAHDERRTWTIRYRVRCAVDVHADTAHLLWQFVGRGWTVPTDRAVITVHLPEVALRPPPRPQFPCSPADPAPDGRVGATRPLERGETRAWGHGPLQGEVRLPNAETVVLDVSDLPPETFVEGSILFPSDAVPLQYGSAIPRFDDILAEERELAERANRIRAQAREEERRRRMARALGWGVLVAVPLLGLAAAASMRRRDRVPGVPEVLSEPPEPAIRPSRLALEWSTFRRKIDAPNAFRAQLLALARERFIEIRPIGRVSDATDYELVLRSVPPDDLDADFVQALFREGRPVRTGAFAPTKTQLKALGRWWDAIIKAARAGARLSRPGFWPFVAFAFAAPYWTIPFAVIVGLPWWWVVAVIAMGVATPLVMRRVVPLRYPPERMERMQRWWAFRRYLQRFSSLPEAPAAAIVIWEEYLAFAVALGVADRVEKQVRAVVPAHRLASPWSGPAASALPPPSLSSLIANVSTRSLMTSSSMRPSGGGSSYAGASSSSFSSGGGFGGGFSSGGGGGGGGTGGGAG